jgi:vacuolar protein sorting-associated protein 35
MRIANQCMDGLVRVQLFVELLNHYLYFMKKECENKKAADSSVRDEIIGLLNTQIINKIKEELPKLERNEEREQINKHFENTKDHIKSVSSGTPIFKEIQLWEDDDE